MSNKIKMIVLTAGLLFGFIAGTAQATTITGTVAYYFTEDYTNGQIYTFANLLTNSGDEVCYYIGNNTALASIFKTAQATGKTVTMNCNTSFQITMVAN